MLDNRTYLDFYRKIDGYKILDNGAAEGALIEDDELIDRAFAIEADEIVIPDVMQDTNETIARCRSFRMLRKRHQEQFRFTGVIQGKTSAELIKCFYFYEGEPNVNVLAVPRNINTREIPNARYAFITAIADETTRPIHCLGATSYNPLEPILLSSLKRVRSLDTCAPISTGYYAQSIKDPSPGRQLNYFDLPAPDLIQEKWIYDNIGTYFEWAGYDPYGIN